MARILVFDPFNGVAGDMVLGAMLDLGVPLEHLEEQLGKLPVGGYRLQAARVQRKGLSAVDFKVEIGRLQDAPGDARPLKAVERQSDEPDHHHHHHHDHHHHGHHHHSPQDHVHEHHHHGEREPAPQVLDGGQGKRNHEHRTFSGIRSLIEASALEPDVKALAIRVFTRLAVAEAKVHGTDLEEVHFHEVGAVDSIVDIVGCAVGCRYLGVSDFFTRPVHLGGGTITFSHGTWPVPAPATSELLRGFAVKLDEMEFELTTPTGAAIVSTLVNPEAVVPEFRLLGVGVGAGDRELPGIPNVLRLILGETGKPADLTGLPAHSEAVCCLEANIDDLDGEALGRFLELALEQGALDVSYGPLVMKKSRPGQAVMLICRPDDRMKFLDLMFRETTTLGIRSSQVERFCLGRESVVVESPWGPVACKRVRYQGRVLDVSPEYEDLKRIASRTGEALLAVRRAVADRIVEQRLWEKDSI